MESIRIFYPTSGIYATHKRDAITRRIVPEMGQTFESALARVVRARCESSHNVRTVKQLAKAAQISTGTAGRIMTGEVSVGVDKLPRVAHALGLSVSDLVREAEAAMGTGANVPPTPAPTPALSVREPTPVWTEDLGSWMSTLSDRQRRFMLYVRSVVTSLPDQRLDAVESMIHMLVPDPDGKSDERDNSKRHRVKKGSA